jgi:hypothetical protein
MTKPDFFIVGAAKSGTTSMHEYLRQHPDVFMPGIKEPLFFGRDLGIAPQWCVRDEAGYLALFDGAAGRRRVGESSVWYICSSTAPGEIKQFSPSAQIIIMLRHPVDFMYSMHGLFLWTDNEDIADFEDALAAQQDRSRGRRIPKMAYFPQGLQYTRMARFSEQVKRYFDVFGPDRVHVILYDDLKSDTPGVYRQVLRFLGLDTSFVPDFRIFNESRPIRHLPFHRFFNRPRARRALQKALPKLSRTLRTKLVNALTFILRPPYRSPRIDPEVRDRLLPDFAEEIEALGKLLGRDLTAWSEPLCKAPAGLPA